MGKVFKKTFRTSGLDERKGNGTRFSWKFSGQCYTFFLAFSPVSLTDIALMLVWSLHSAQWQWTNLSLTFKTDDVTSGRRDVD